MTWEIREGDALTRLREIPDESVHCVVTSPPYWGLRDYGTAKWDGGDPECSHEPSQKWIDHNFNNNSAFGKSSATQSAAARPRWYNNDGSCRCGAHRTDSQIGLESTPEEYVATMVDVFCEVRRVLRDDGTLWLNLGDSYARRTGIGRGKRNTGLKPKDMVGIPWRVAFALQADGWYLRSDIIWHKPNPMPESVTDRPTKSHEYIFLLSKSKRYFYDADAIWVAHQPVSLARAKRERNGAKYAGSDPAEHSSLKMGENYGQGGDPDEVCSPGGRNARSVWTIATQPYAEAHFATFPPELAARCIRAGSSSKGCCPVCGAPWERQVERTPMVVEPSASRADTDAQGLRTQTRGTMTQAPTSRTTGWRSTCPCPSYARDAGVPVRTPVPCTVLDPFSGSGTTVAQAVKLGRSGIGIELSADYAAMSRRRVLKATGTQPIEGTKPNHADLPIFRDAP